MNNSFTIEELICGYYDKEISETEVMELPKFSRRCIKRLNKCFALFECNSAKENTHENDIVSAHGFKLNGKTLVIILAAVFLLSIAGCAAYYFTAPEFKGKVYTDHTQLLVIDKENRPKAIDINYKSDIPDFFEEISTDTNPFSRTIRYKNKNGNSTFVISEYINSDEDKNDMNNNRLNR